VKKSVLIGLAFILSWGIACGHAKKTAAEASLRLADQAWASLGPEAQSLAPDEFKRVQESINAAHEALNKRDYDAALAAAKDLPGKVRDLRVAIQTKKDELTAQWQQLNETMPGMVSAVQARMDRLHKSRHHLPDGAAAELAAAKQNWGDASLAFQADQLFEALAKGSEARNQLADLQKKLGMKPD
jgi:hypothetical protein